MIGAHFDAFRDRIRQDPDLADKVEDTARVDGDGVQIYAQYVILFGGSPDDIDDDRFTKEQDLQSTHEFVYTTRCVGVTPEAVRALVNAVFAQLLGARLEVDGRRIDAIRHTGSTDIVPDRSINPPLFSCDDEWTVISRRPTP